jgi:hypothetical protein
MLALLFLAALQAPAAQPSPTPSPAGPAVAAPASPAPAVARKRERKAVTEPTKGQRKYISGTLGGIDIEALTVRFVDEQGTQHVWKVDARMAANSPARAEEAAAAFQPGQPITVTYHEDGPEPLVIEVSRRSPATQDK